MTQYQRLFVKSFCKIALIIFLFTSAVFAIKKGERINVKIITIKANLKYRGIRMRDKMNLVKEEAKKLIDKLPNKVTWDDIIYEFYVKKKLSMALKAAKEGRVVPHEKVRKKFLSE